jgi:DNA-binding transcriptional MerR regulator
VSKDTDSLERGSGYKEESRMLRIGDFSRLAQVTVITLRHYDQIGLLKPQEVDPETGYRYYSLTQLPRLNRILLLKDLGFNLDQIAKLIDDNLSTEQMAGMLKLKRAEIEQQIALEQSRLSQIEARLHLIQNEDQLPAYDILIKKVEPLRVLAIHDIVDYYGQVELLWRELKKYMRQHRFEWVYPNIAIWQEIEYRENDIVVEAAVPFNEKIPTTSRIQVQTLPGVEMMVSTIHQGDYVNLMQAYDAMIKWCEANSLRIGKPIRELYLQYDRNNSAANLTEIQLPVEKI